MKSQSDKTNFKVSRAILWDGSAISKVINLTDMILTSNELEAYRESLKNESGCEVYFEYKEQF